MALPRAIIPPQSDGQTDAPGTPSSEVSQWLSAIARAQQDMKDWTDRCEKIRRRYRYQSSQKVKRRQFQMLWANIELLKPAVYAKPPKPVVEERFKSGSPIARIASQVLERNLNFQSDFKNYDRTFGMCRDDFLLYGRGVPRLRYYPVFEEAEVPDPVGGPEDAEGYENDNSEPPATPGIGEAPQEPAQTIKTENICVDFVQRDDLIHPFVRIWEELPWLTYRAFLNRAELIERFGKKIGKAIPLDCVGGQVALNQGTDRKESAEDKATIYEIWDKANNRVLWIAAGYPEVCDESEPYLKFKDFFASPRPAYGTITTDSLIPIPDYTYYQDQAQEIDDLTARIASLSDSLKLVGFYPAGPQGEGQPEIERAVRPGIENKMIAVKSWDAFKAAGGGGAPIVWLPVENVEQILRGCVELRKQLIDDVYQITGISDIQRGASEATETLGAQQLKAQWGGIRMRERQAEIARLCRDTTRMVGEIMCTTFQVSTLLECADMRLPTAADVQQAQMQAALAQQQWQQASQQAQIAGTPPPEAPPPAPDMGPTVEDLEAFLRNKVEVAFKIDIEVDSTINADESQEKQDRIEFITSTSQFIAQWGPIVQAQPKLAPLAGELLLFGVKAFRTARQLEGVIEQYVKGLEQEAAQPPAPPPPDPVQQAKLEQVQQEGANSKQLHDQQMQQNDQLHQQKLAQNQQEADLKQQQQRDEFAMKEREHLHRVELAKHQVESSQTSLEGAKLANQHKMEGLQAQRDAANQNAALAESKAQNDEGRAARGESRAEQADQRKASESKDKEQTPAIMELSKALIAELKKNGEAQTQAYKELVTLIKQPKRLTVGKRDPNGRIADAEIS